MYPNEATVRESIGECLAGENAFLRKYASGARPREFYLVYEDKRLPLKAVWAASHRPPIHTRDFNTDQAKAGLFSLGFNHFWPEQNSN